MTDNTEVNDNASPQTPETEILLNPDDSILITEDSRATDEVSHNTVLDLEQLDRKLR